jgi:hypothetical protein
MSSSEHNYGATPVEVSGRSNFVRDIIIQDIAEHKHGGFV